MRAAALAGPLLLALPALYAGVMGWLRGGWQRNRAAAEAAQAVAETPTGGTGEAAAGRAGEIVADAPAGTTETVDAESANVAARHHATAKPSLANRAVGPPIGAVANAAPAETASLLFSVLIAARDEAATLPVLLADLATQTLPAAAFEVLIADDHSTDGTGALVRAAAATVPFLLRLVELTDAQTGKKAALAAALAQAGAPWLVCTDADCRPGPGWLAAYARALAGADRLGPATPPPAPPQKGGVRSMSSFQVLAPLPFGEGPGEGLPDFISGPVLLTGPDTFFQRLLGLEFAGLVGVGAACIGRGAPTMCNGANLAYRRAAFEAARGYTAHAHLASGDDEFLMHQLHAARPGSVRFLADAAAVVRTAAPATVGALLRQRVRWASKWRHYQNPASRRLALLVLGANVALAAGAAAALARPALGPWVGAAWGLKLGADWWLLAPVLRFLGPRRWLWQLLPLQLLYAPYALAVGAAGWRGGYSWKGRAVR